MAAPQRPSPTPSSPTDQVLILLGSIRAAARRHRLRRVVLSTLLAAAAGLIVNQLATDAATRAESWEPAGVVWVTTRSVAAGEPIPAEALASRPVPAALRPPDAVTEDPTGVRTSVALVPQEIVREGRLATTATGAIGARLPPGWSAVALPDGALPAVVGDPVAVHDLTSGAALTAGAIVVGRTERDLVVGIGPADVGAVVRSLGAGGAVVVLRRPSS